MPGEGVVVLPGLVLVDPAPGLVVVDWPPGVLGEGVVDGVVAPVVEPVSVRVLSTAVPDRAAHPDESPNEVTTVRTPSSPNLFLCFMQPSCMDWTSLCAIDYKIAVRQRHQMKSLASARRAWPSSTCTTLIFFNFVGDS